MTGKLRELLKAATHELHTQVESSAGMGRLLHEDLTRGQYVDTLRRLYTIYQPVETALRTVPGLQAWLPDYERRWKTDSLRRDLQALGATVPAAQPPVNVTALPEAAGMIYVLEGSTLGARVIAKALRNRPFIDDGNLTFFTHYGEQSGAHWQRFLAALEELNGEDHDAVFKGAKRAFQLFM